MAKISALTALASLDDISDVFPIVDTSASATKKITVGNVLAKLQDGSILYAADSVGTDAYAVTLSPAPTAYTTGMTVNFKSGTANTGAATLNVNALGAKTIKKNRDQDLATNDIEASQMVTVIYDGTNFQMQSQLANAGITTDGTETITGGKTFSGNNTFSGTNTHTGPELFTGNLIGKLFAPQGFLINGKIVPSVSGNNLTVAIKTLAGADPSATDPVYCRIGDTVRAITTALSVTKNSGTNWFGSGGTLFATKEIDYFVYLGYNATDGVVVGFARVPYGTQYDSFSATSTNEEYCAISTITNAAATDYYEVIGRFAATLSAGAGYTWTVPTFTSINLKQRPVFNTRKLSYAPTVTWDGTPPSTTTLEAYYVFDRDRCTLDVKQNNTGAGTSNTQVTFAGPLSAVVTGSEYGIAGNGLVSTAIIGSAPTGSARAVGYGVTPDIYLFFSSISARSFTVNITYPIN